MKPLLLCLTAGWLAAGLTARADTPPAAAVPAAPAIVAPAAPVAPTPPLVVPVTADQALIAKLGGEPLVYEVIRHLYRWYLTEADIERHISEPTLEVWVRELHPKLDAGDKSEFAEMVLPGIQVRIVLKKTDYWIEELKLEVKSGSYKIQNLAHEAPPASSAGYVIQQINLPMLVDYLFKSRSQREFPDDSLALRLHKAMVAELKAHAATPPPPFHGLHICDVAPLSPVSNELWVYWENGRTLIRFSSDLDLTNPAVWSQENLTIRTFTIDTQVVVSLAETAGSNAFLTREQAGRILYNCIVMGQRREVAPMMTPPGAAPAAAPGGATPAPTTPTPPAGSATAPLPSPAAVSTTAP